jgi:hypothetical protein
MRERQFIDSLAYRFLFGSCKIAIYFIFFSHYVLKSGNGTEKTGFHLPLTTWAPSSTPSLYLSNGDNWLQLRVS